MEEGGRMSPLDGRPTLDELARHITVGVKWNLLGVQLKLDDRLLDVIDRDKHSTEDKLCAMFQAWLHEKPEATRRDVIEALKIIRDLDIAEKYEKTWKEADKSVDPPKNIEKSLERCRSQIEKPAENEQDWTKKFYYLKEMFDRHVLPPIMELIRVDDAKRRFRKTLHNNFGCNEEFLKVHRSDLDKIEKVEDFVRFLIDLNFLSYLNYQHLKDLAGDDCAAHFADYEKLYCDVLSKISLPHIAFVFRNNPGLVPGKIIGFPTLRFELKQTDSYPTLQDWTEFLHPELPSHIANIQAGDDGSITITYTMYPPDFFSCVSILKEPEFIKTILNNEVTPHLKLCQNEGIIDLPCTDHDDGDDANIDMKAGGNKETQAATSRTDPSSQILRPLGIQEYKCPDGPVVQYKGLLFTTDDLKAKLTDPDTMINVQTALLSFSGLPKSGKTTAVTLFLEHYVAESSLESISSKHNRPEEHVGIAHYDLIAVSSLPGEEYEVTEAAQESSFAFGVLSIFKSILEDEKRVPLLDAKAIRMKCFKNFHLNDHFHHMCRFLQKSISKGSEHSNDGGELVNSFLHCVPESIALVNIWDMASSNTVHHLLSALEGYLFRSHLWLFVDLDDDLEKLDENFEIPKNGQDGAILLKQRPRLHYLLRSCWSTRDNNKERKREDVCTMFAKHRKTGQGEAQSKVNVLKEKVQPVANHIGVAGLLDERIENINLDTQHKRLNDKFQRILIDGTKPDKIPLSWLFLRSLFYRFPKTFVSKDDLMEMAKECGMDERSVEDFCKFFTSFGSIIDLSLVDPHYQYVIVKPITFLQSLDSFFSKKNQLYPSMDYGIVPEKACRESFKDDWPIFMDALECLNLATPVTTRFLEMPPDVPLDRRGNYYYIPLCCTGPVFDEPDPYSVHLLTNINTPHFFKQVSFAKQLLDTLPHPVLVPCKNMNQTIIKNVAPDTTITISSHVPAIKLKVDKPNEEICALIIQATEKIADESHVPVKYKFVQFCVQHPLTKVESLPSASYHRLPEGRCKKCRRDPKFEKLLKAWTEALRENEIPDRFKATGDVGLTELSEIAERIRDMSTADDVHDIARVLEVDNFEDIAENDPIGRILKRWSEKKNGGDFEPRRALAQKIYPELGEVIAKKATDEKTKMKIKQRYEKLAKDIDVYYRYDP